MATALKDKDIAPAVYSESIKQKKVGIVVAQWNREITSKLAEGARKALLEAGIAEDNIVMKEVPGAFELPLGAQLLLEHASLDGVIAIGCLIKGETPHFHYISEAVSLCLCQLNLRYAKPVSFGVLTVDTLGQAEERTGGSLGNKGEEAAAACLHMLTFKEDTRKQKSKSSIGFGGSSE